VPPTPYPTQVPSTKVPQSNTVSILNSFGFYRDPAFDIADLKGTAYSNMTYEMVLWIYADGTFGESSQIGNVDGGDQGNLFGNVLIALFHDTGLVTYIANGIGQIGNYNVPHTLDGTYGTYKIEISTGRLNNGNLVLSVVIEGAHIQGSTY
jgi:hypothetical protein